MNTKLSYDDSPVNLEYISDDAFDVQKNKFMCKIKIERYHYLNSYCIEYTQYTIPISVKVVDYYAFGSSDITNIVIPESVERVNDLAFKLCPYLSSVTINAKQISFGIEVFADCDVLESINIPAGVTSFGKYCFAGVTNINYPNNIEKIVPGAFSGSMASTINIPEGVTEIGKHAFYLCGKLQTINIPSSVKIIGAEAFYKCSELKTISIPDRITEIGDKAFYKCVMLSSVNIPSSIERIGLLAFDSSTSINVIGTQSQEDVIPIFKYYNKAFETDYFSVSENIHKIDSYAFSKCSLQTIHLPNVVEIGFCAFAECRNLQTINLPESLLKINSHAFYECVLLNNINLPSHLEYFGEHVIDGTRITRLVIPDTVVFYGIQDNSRVPLEYIKLPSSMKEIRSNEFKNSNLKTIELSADLENISSYSFSGSKQLESIIIPSKVKIIDNYAFSYCSKLTSAAFLGKIEFFGYHCFASTNITKITIPNSATFVNEALSECNNLEKITFGDVNFSYHPREVFEYKIKPNKQIEVHYIGREKNDYNVNGFFYYLVKNNASVVYVKKTYLMNTFCTKIAEKYMTIPLENMISNHFLGLCNLISIVVFSS